MNCLKICSILLCFGLNSALIGVPKYTISEFDIQKLEGTIEREIDFSDAARINNLGQVVGSYSAYGDPWPISRNAIYIWHQETGFKLIAVDNNNKRAPVINDNGMVAWTTYVNEPNATNHCVSYLYDSKSQSIEQLRCSEDYRLNDINNNNVTIGNNSNSGVNQYYFNKYCTDKNRKFFRVMNHNITAINNKSQIIGFLAFQIKNKNFAHGYLFDGLEIIDLGKDVHPEDINDRGQIVGVIYEKVSSYAFLWENGSFTNLQSNARAFAVNEHGDVVGDLGKGDDQRAFLYTDGMVYDLLNLVIDNNGWSKLNVAQDISDKRQIVGYGQCNGKMTGFLLNPIEDE